MKRQAEVAGTFYPKNKKQLEDQLKKLFEKVPESKKSQCIVAPHAGYTYSGKTAAVSFNAVEKAETFVILGTGHTGLGSKISVSTADSWETPLGEAKIDSKLRKSLLETLGIQGDTVAHIGEHSCEVQIPFIQFLFPKAKILPIVVGTPDLGKLEALGNALFKAQKGKSVSVVASGDFSHFIPKEEAKKIDLEAIALIEKMDIPGFYSLVTRKRLSICGLSPITAAMFFAKKLGLKKGKLLKYDSSATATGDIGRVVGYAAIEFE
jgi:AmmeMemoRadiSam system protein B